MSDQKFPVIIYPPNKTPLFLGRMHGECFKKGIQELSGIRKELLLERGPSLKNNWESLAMKQFSATKEYSPDLAEELTGLAQGAELSIPHIILLNNYTDFRDLEDNGCSTVHFQKSNSVFAGQTWDMHKSAKDYCAVLQIPEQENLPSVILFTLVGCLGMTGINTEGLFIGINNINTQYARPRVLWPAIVRHCLKNKDYSSMKTSLLDSPITSGHNYMLSGRRQAQHWEILPQKAQMVDKLDQGESGAIFHTNHCLGDETKSFEMKDKISSTSHIRLDLLRKKAPSITSFPDLLSLLTDHENYPRSICGHFEANSMDPSSTCGGVAADLVNGDCHFWRGCPEYDDNHIHRRFKYKKDSFREII